MSRPDRLFVLAVSPWSERAKWALDHHRIAYETIQHAPFLGERRLRRLVGTGKERATVPVLITGGQVHYDLQSRRYVVINMTNEEKKMIEWDYDKPPSYFTPQQLQKFATTRN